MLCRKGLRSTLWTWGAPLGEGKSGIKAGIVNTKVARWANTPPPTLGACSFFPHEGLLLSKVLIGGLQHCALNGFCILCLGMCYCCFTTLWHAPNGVSKEHSRAAFLRTKLFVRHVGEGGGHCQLHIYAFGKHNFVPTPRQKSARGVWGLGGHSFGGKLYFTSDILEEQWIPKDLLAPASAKPPAKKAKPLPQGAPQNIPVQSGEHVQEFKGKWTGTKKFHTEPMGD